MLCSAQAQDSIQSEAANTESPLLVKTDSIKSQGLQAGRSRYLYAPSSYMLKQGECKIGPLPSFAVGVTDFFSVEVSASIASLVIYHSAFGIGTAKVGYMWDAGVGVHGGVQGFLMDKHTAYLPFGGATLGNEHQQITVNVAQFNTTGSSTKLWFSNVSGSTRIDSTWSLIAEGYYALDHVAIATAARHHGKKFVVDLGFCIVQDIWFPIPLLNVGYYF